MDTIGPILNEKQEEAVQAIKDGKNILVIGPGGSGKSHLIHYLHTFLPSIGRKHAVTAYTGAVCAQVLYECGARTIHSWAGVGLAELDIDVLIKDVRKKSAAVKRWKTTDVLIIDEVSMITADFLEKLDAVAKFFRVSTAPFGGMQLILCGDFLQLPPIFKVKHYGTDAPAAPTQQFCFESVLWPTLIQQTITLTQVWRQSDTDFQQALADIRMGRCSPKTETLIKSRLIAPPCDEKIKPTVLYNRRVDVDEHNDASLEALKKPISTFTAQIHAEIEIPADIKAKLNKMKEDFDKDSSYCTSLRLAEGAQVMLIINLDQDKGLANGSRGIITGFDGAGNPIVEFRNGHKQTIREHMWRFGTASIPTATTATTAETGQMQLLADEDDVAGMPTGYKRIGIYIKQYPLRLAYAITCHKSQGMTLDCINIDLGSSIFEYGQAYVALSRVKSLDGLYIMAFDKTKIRANPRVLRFVSGALTTPPPPAPASLKPAITIIKRKKPSPTTLTSTTTKQTTLTFV